MTDPRYIMPGTQDAESMTHPPPLPAAPRLPDMGPSWLEQAAADQKRLDDIRASGGNSLSSENLEPTLGLLGGFMGGNIKPMGGLFSAGGKLGQAAGGFKFFHASPHDFDQFDISKIGTGEGATAYAHGLYGAGVKDTAQWYYDNFRKRFGQAKLYRGYADVNVDHFLDWDKSVEEQTPHVQSIMKELHPDAKNPNYPMTGEDFHNDLAGFHDMSLEESGSSLSDWARGKEAQKRAAQELYSSGIPGIRYLDQNSKQAFQTMKELQEIVADKKNIRSSRLGRENAASAIERLKSTHYPLTHNYVFFDDKYLKVLSKFGIAGIIGQGMKHFSAIPVEEDPFDDSN